MQEKLMKLVRAQATNKIAFKIQYKNEIYNYNEHDIFPAASTIKLPISMLNIIESEKGYNNLLNIEKRVGGTGVLHSLRDIKNLSLRDAIALSIIVSDNTTSNMLIDNIGLQDLNYKMKEIGLYYTTIDRYFMDEVAIAQGKNNYTTVSDALKFINYVAEENEVFGSQEREELYEIMQNQQFNDRIGCTLNFSKESIILASKTGTLNCLEHDIGILRKGPSCIKYAVFSDGWNSNKEGRDFLSDFGEILIEYLGRE